MQSTEMVRRREQEGDMLPLLERHEIQVLLRAGHSHAEVAEHAGVSLDSVRRVKHARRT